MSRSFALLLAVLSLSIPACFAGPDKALLSVREVILFLAISIVVLGVIPVSSGEGSPMKLLLKIEQSSGNSSEIAEVLVVFENVSNEDFFINTAVNYFRDKTSLKFNIVSQNGSVAKEKVVMLGKRKVLNRNDFYLLKKGQIYAQTIDLSCWYDLNQSGPYIVTATYSNEEYGQGINLKPFWKFWGNPFRVWKGSVISNSIEIGAIR